VRYDEVTVADGTFLSCTVTQQSTWVRLNDPDAAATLGLDTARWMLLDRSQIASSSRYAPQNFLGGRMHDALGLGDLFAHVNQVYPSVNYMYDGTSIFFQANEEDYVLGGTVNLTAAVPGPHALSPATIARLGDRLSAVPFEATVDPRGRLIDLSIYSNTDAEVNAAIKDDVTLDYGSALPAPMPDPGDVIPAPPAAYQLVATA
jgi:hypothetical protein